MLRHSLQKNWPGWAAKNVVTRSALVSTLCGRKTGGGHLSEPRKSRAVAATGCVETELGNEGGFPVAASDPTQPL